MKTTLCLLALGTLLIGCKEKVTTTTISPDGRTVTETTTVITPDAPLSKVTQANLSLIHTDMSKADVERILGQPTSSRSEPIPIVGGTTTVYSYITDDASITIVFKNDMVKEKSGSFNP